MQWFRLHTDFLYNPKIQIVTEALRYRYVALLCLHCAGNYENRPDDEIALSLRITVDEWISTRNEFVKRELLTADYKIKGWEKKQYISDIKDPTAAERQKRYREKHRDKRNATVTSRLPDSDTDTDTEERQSKKITLESLSTEHIKEWLDEKRKQGIYIKHDEKFILERFRLYCQGKGKTYKNYVAAYKQAFEWDSCQPKQFATAKKSNVVVL